MKIELRKAKYNKRLRAIARSAKLLPHGRIEVLLGCNLDEFEFDAVRAALGNPDVRSVAYSRPPAHVIETVEVEIDDVRFRAHRSRPATEDEIAKLSGTGTTEHAIHYHTVKVP